jgi:hypothetical protein
MTQVRDGRQLVTTREEEDIVGIRYQETASEDGLRRRNMCYSKL